MANKIKTIAANLLAENGDQLKILSLQVLACVCMGYIAIYFIYQVFRTE